MGALALARWAKKWPGFTTTLASLGRLSTLCFASALQQQVALVGGTNGSALSHASLCVGGVSQASFAYRAAPRMDRARHLPDDREGGRTSRGGALPRRGGMNNRTRDYGTMTHTAT